MEMLLQTNKYHTQLQYNKQTDNTLSYNTPNRQTKYPTVIQ